MFLKERSNGHLVEVLSVTVLFNPYKASIKGRSHFGEEAQDPESFAKTDLAFLSGEALPRCWTDPHYRDHELARH